MKRFLRSLHYAAGGLKEAISERNFFIEVVAGALAIGLSFALSIGGLEKLIILLCVAIVLSVEVTNSAVERLLDFVSREHREEIREIKDLMAAAVLIVATAAFVIGIAIFGPALLSH